MNAISQAVILMAGSGSRLNSIRAANSIKSLKPLTPILGRPLISYVFEALGGAGIKTIHAVVGYESTLLTPRVEALVPRGLTIRFIENPQWQKQNGISVLAAAGQVKSPFVLAMSDHLFDHSVIALLLRHAVPRELNLAVDRKIESIVDLNDAMKVGSRGDRILSIGKELDRYDAIDTGLFVADENLFRYLEKAKRGGDCSLADGVRSMAAAGKVRAIDIGEAWWQDIDTPETLAAAENHLRLRTSDLGLVATGSRAEE